MKIIRTTPEQAPTKAAEVLAEFLRGIRETPVLLLLAGGSALKLLDKLPAGAVGTSVTAAVLDERYSTDSKENNFAKVLAAGFVPEGAAVIDTRVQEGETQEALASRFNEELHRWVEQNPAGVIAATVGIGPDGHVAGIMPYPENPERFAELFEQKDAWTAAYDATGKNDIPLRVTTTMPFLRRIQHAVVFASGEGKRKSVERVTADQGTLAETPARILREMPDVILVTDIAP